MHVSEVKELQNIEQQNTEPKKVRYFVRCFSAAFYDHALPHFAKLGAVRGV